MSIEAMKQALEALETTQTLMRLSDPQYVREYNAITSLRQAIAEAEKQTSVSEVEPVAHLKLMMEHSAFDGRLELSDALANIDEFYTHPQPKRELVGLTDDEIEDCYKQGGIGRAIQMLKEKNT